MEKGVSIPKITSCNINNSEVLINRWYGDCLLLYDFYKLLCEYTDSDIF